MPRIKARIKTVKKRSGIKHKFVPKPPEDLEVIAARWEKKKDRIHQLAHNISRLRLNVTKDLKSEDQKESLTALIIAIIDKTGERIGNNESASEGHHGVSGFLKKHISIKGNEITLTYTGKSGVDQEKIFNSEKIAKGLKKAIKNSTDKRVFTTTEGQWIGSEQVNRYLKSFDVSAKDLRGFYVNNAVAEKLSSLDIPEKEKDRKKLFNKTCKLVASKVGHGSGTCKKHYIVPELMEQYITHGKIIDLKSQNYYKDGGEISKGDEIKSNILEELIDKQIEKEKSAGQDYPQSVTYKNYLESIKKAKDKKEILQLTYELNDYLKRADKYVWQPNPQTDEIRDSLFVLLKEKRKEVLPKYDFSKPQKFVNDFIEERSKALSLSKGFLKNAQTTSDREVRSIVWDMQGIVDYLKEPESIGLFEETQYPTLRQNLSADFKMLRRKIQKLGFGYDSYNERYIDSFEKLVYEVANLKEEGGEVESSSIIKRSEFLRNGGSIGGNYQFKNEFGSFTSVKIMPVDENLRSSNNYFTVEVTVRRKGPDEQVIIQSPKYKTFPVDKYDEYIEDLRSRGADVKMSEGGETKPTSIIKRREWEYKMMKEGGGISSKDDDFANSNKTSNFNQNTTKDELQINYNMDDARYIPFSKLVSFDWKLKEVVQDIREGKLSHSKDKPLTVTYLPHLRKYLIQDGNHRVIENILDGESQIPAIINEHQPKMYAFQIDDSQLVSISDYNIGIGGIRYREILAGNYQKSPSGFSNEVEVLRQMNIIKRREALAVMNPIKRRELEYQLTSR